MSEQNNPETLARLRRRIQRVREADKLEPMLDRFSFASGYLAALNEQRLLSDEVYAELALELNAAQRDWKEPTP